ncbi:MAG: hypothetical protein LBC72_00545 [Spirochaetaceae bacterium]|jgi:hypothetical protein|nr:hypothetical protein [Spirochaetaceae bacterium]
MKKHILPRILFYCALFIILFIALSLLQWAGHDSFSRKIGGLAISGKYARGAGGLVAKARSSAAGDEYDLAGIAKITFKGLEIPLAAGETAVRYTVDGHVRQLTPRAMQLSAEYARFTLAAASDSAPAGDVELNFYLRKDGETEELVISAVLPDAAGELAVPFTAGRRGGMRVVNDEILVSADGAEWCFDRSIPGIRAGVFTLTQKNPAVAYQRRGSRGFNLMEFIVSGALEKPRFDEITGQWRDKLYAYWTTLIPASTDERLISAWVAEASRRGFYNEALARLPEAFAASQARTYVSSPFMGRLPQALRSKSEHERATQERLSRLLRENPAGILLEDRVFVYLGQRNYTALFDEAVRAVKQISPDMLSPEMFPAIFEGWWAWTIWRAKEENPFDLLAYQARLVIVEQLKKDPESGDVFIVDNHHIDMRYNIRLGCAIILYGEKSGNSDWAAVGRSLILSALAYSNDIGSLPSILDETGGVFFVSEDGEPIDALETYLSAAISDYYPHAVGVSTLVKDVWIWTMAPSIVAAYKNNALDFGVTFQAGGTHYLMISGLRPFSKIQIRDIDYRSDPQFESWSAPGWVYSPSEQTLLVKLVHRAPMEHIKIFF